MQPEIFDLGLRNGSRECLLGPPKISVAFTVGEHQRWAIERSWQAGDDAANGRGQWGKPGFAVLRLGIVSTPLSRSTFFKRISSNSLLRRPVCKSTVSRCRSASEARAFEATSPQRRDVG